MNEIVVRVRELSKQFGDNRALDAVSFEMKQGEVVGYVGPNGSGKTTTMRILLGLLPPDGGSIEIFGHDVQREFAHIGPRLGAVLDAHCLHPQLTVRETLMFYAELYGLNRSQRQENIAWLAGQMGLEQVMPARTKTLSKGMRQRLAFARSLVHRPDLLFLDEPFDGIDTETQRHLREMVRDLAREQGVTIFLTSHDLHEVEQLADRVNILKQGHIVACDTTENLKRSLHRNRIDIHFHAQMDVTYLQSVLAGTGFHGTINLQEGGYAATIELQNGDPADVVLEKLIADGIRLRAFAPVKTSLEDAYFDVIDGPPAAS
ncbi:MAG: ABC transporter ATP-binding protein [Anaerolineales bacterium]|nr:ABC transporter ATP-binding protein [Anaerolineales bacterium]MCB8950645.1 ABC transporter ATP-binding protein [Ardenticatenales bacterium]